MRIHSLLHGSGANGPGVRTVVWTQGCALACDNCWNPETHSFTAGRITTPEDLATDILLGAPDKTTGVTISGGEPMSQGVAVCALLVHLRMARPEWSIGMFTGHTFTELNTGAYTLVDYPNFSGFQNPPSPEAWKAQLWKQVAGRLDWVKYGRFDPTMKAAINPEREDAHWVTSGNQWLHILNRGRHTYADFKPLSVEVKIGRDGLHIVTGFPVLGSLSRAT